jgi:hypothetical protein
MSGMYLSGVDGFGDGSFTWTGSAIKVMLIQSTYAFDSTQQYVSDLGDVISGRSDALTGKFVANKAFGADDTGVISDTQDIPCNALVIYYDTGHDNTSRLIYYCNAAYVGLPIRPAKKQLVQILWSTGENKIFRL